MYPMDFEEFLWACGYEGLAEEIRMCAVNDKSMPAALYDRCPSATINDPPSRLAQSHKMSNLP